MFRPLRRITDEKRANCSLPPARRRLPSTAMMATPMPFPSTTSLTPSDDKIYFHGAKAGHKVDSLRHDDKVCFTVYGNVWYKDGDWAPTL